MTSGWHRKPHNEAARQRKRQYNSAEYKDAKAQAQLQVDAGLAHCWRCGKWLAPQREWHLGHDDHNRLIIRGPECPPCNVKAASRKGAQIANANRQCRRQTGPKRWAL